MLYSKHISFSKKLEFKSKYFLDVDTYLFISELNRCMYFEVKEFLKGKAK